MLRVVPDVIQVENCGEPVSMLTDETPTMRLWCPLATDGRKLSASCSVLKQPSRTACLKLRNWLQDSVTECWTEWLVPPIRTLMLLRLPSILVISLLTVLTSARLYRQAR